MLVLVDQDGVLADFDGGFTRIWAEKYPDRPVIGPELRRNFSLLDDYPEEYSSDIREIWATAGFILGLPPVPGALQSVRAMLEIGHDVRLCTSPLSRFRHCVAEKYQWVRDHLGQDWVARIILTRDKTVVRGDVLLDDKPEVTGVLLPEWEHLVFDAPYNVGAKGRRINWENWPEVLAEVETGRRVAG